MLYLAGMIAVGIIFTRKNKNLDDFYLGGRHLGPFVTAMSAEASDMSGWLLMGLPGVVYALGFAEAAWTAIGLGVGTYLNWLFVSKRLRRYSERINAITLPEFFEKRFEDKSHALLIIAALVILLFFVPYTGSGFSTCGKLFGSLFGVDYHIAMIISAVVIVLYTTLGGFLAASTTDLIQSIIMTIALITVLAFGIKVAGGWEAVTVNAAKITDYISLTKTPTSVIESGKYDFMTILSTLAWGLGYFGMPHILLRFMAMKDPKKAAMSRRIASVWVVIAMGVAIVIGIVGFAMSTVEPSMVLEDSETVIVAISKLLSTNGAVFALLAGLILAGILASTMSTADSQLIAASSAISEDFISDVFDEKSKKKLDEKKKLLIGRLVCIVIAALGILFAWDPDSSVFKIVSFAWAGFGATFGPLMLFSLFWKRTTRNGALAGMIVGAVTVVVWHYLKGGIFSLYELLPAFILSSLFIVIFSLAGKKPSASIEAAFEDAKSLGVN